MFTALHINTDATEDLYECERVSVSRGHGQEPGYGPGVFLTLTKGQEHQRVSIPFCAARATNEKASPVVIVMNSNGKTVAKYDL